jgi:hypothetical protein
MRPPRIRTSVPSLITTIIVLALLLALVMDLRDRARKKAAYQQARIAREVAEQTAARLRRRKPLNDAAFQEIESELERARADERIKRADLERVLGIGSGFFR